MGGMNQTRMYYWLQSMLTFLVHLMASIRCTRSFSPHSCPLCLTIISKGAGTVLSPLSATYFAQVPHWSFHFLICLEHLFDDRVSVETPRRSVCHEAYGVDAELDLLPACLAEIGITDTKKGTSEQSPLRQILGLRDCTSSLRLFSFMSAQK